MTATWLGLALAAGAAVATAAAHAFLKSGSDRMATRLVLGATEALVALPVVVLLPLPDAELARWLALSTAVHVIYQLVLIRAYDAADFSTAFPLARGVAPLATAGIGVWLLNDQLDPVALLGVAMISGGLLLMAARGRIATVGLIAALGAGLLTTAYTLIDAAAVRAAPSPLHFIAWFFLLDGLGLIPIALATRGMEVVRAARANWRRGAIAGVITLAGFGSALWALALAPAGAVSALRESGVVVAVLIGWLVLKEPVKADRMAAAVIVALGAGLVALSA